MGNVNLTSKTWESAAQLLEWRLAIAGPIAGASLAVCILAQIVFYIFPRLRVFPRSLLSWLNWYNIFFEIYIILKWSPYSALNSDWILHVTEGSFLCRFGLFLDQMFLLGPMACTTLLCLTVFLIIVMKVEMENRRPFFWGYLAFATVYPIVVAIPAAATPNIVLKGFGTCSNGDKSLMTGLRAVYAVLTILQVLLFVATFCYAKRIFKNEKNTTLTAGHFPVKYLFIRCFATFLSQTFTLLPAQLMDFSSVYTPVLAANAIYFRFAVVSRYIGPMVDALILLFGNVDFIEWVQNKMAVYIKHPHFVTHTSIPTEERRDSQDGEVERDSLDVEKHPVEMRLAAASTTLGTSTPNHFLLQEGERVSNEEL